MKELKANWFNREQLNKAMELLRENYYSEWMKTTLKWHDEKNCSIYYEEEKQLEKLRYCYTSLNEKLK